MSEGALFMATLTPAVSAEPSTCWLSSVLDKTCEPPVGSHWSADQWQLRATVRRKKSGVRQAEARLPHSAGGRNQQPLHLHLVSGVITTTILITPTSIFYYRNISL